VDGAAPAAAPAAPPVTVVVRRRVRPGRAAEYEAWLARLTAAARAEAPGYLGAEFHRPADPGGTYRSVFRFESLAALDAFEHSKLRARMMAEAAPLFAADAAWERLTGLELWFDAPAGTVVAQPSPHRMALVLVAVVFVLVTGLTLLLGPLIAPWPLPLRVLAMVVLQVGLMTYLVMPWLAPRIARFVYPLNPSTRNAP
jgi:antibiotic biosynthesis monooxygenase (ABM) superfamily enzyme